MKDTCIHLSDEMPFSFAAIFYQNEIFLIFLSCLIYIVCDIHR